MEPLLYILLIGVFKKELVPPVKYEGKYNITFFRKVLLSLVPPLALIFVVLGSILLGIATVNQAGAIGAVGAGIMGSYRLYAEKKNKYTPAIISLTSLIVITFLVNIYSDETFELSDESVDTISFVKLSDSMKTLTDFILFDDYSSVEGKQVIESGLNETKEFLRNIKFYKTSNLEICKW